MIISCKQLIQLREVDPNAFKDTMFQRYKGNNGPCVSTIDGGAMTIEQAVAYSKEVEAHDKVKPAEKPAAGQAYTANGQG